MESLLDHGSFDHPRTVKKSCFPVRGCDPLEFQKSFMVLLHSDYMVTCMGDYRQGLDEIIQSLSRAAANKSESDC